MSQNISSDPIEMACLALTSVFSLNNRQKTDPRRSKAILIEFIDYYERRGACPFDPGKDAIGKSPVLSGFGAVGRPGGTERTRENTPYKMGRAISTLLPSYFNF